MVYTAQPRNNPFSEQFCRKLGVFPFDLNAEKSAIATFDPRLSPDKCKQIRFLLGRDFDLVIASPDDIDTAFTFLYSHAHQSEARRPIDLTDSTDGEFSNVQLAKAIFVKPSTNVPLTYTSNPS